MEFMQTQDKRSAHQEKCIGEMSQQVGKLAKAVEGLCGALGPAMRDSINGTLGGEVRHLKDVADEVRRAAGDLSAAASAVRSHPPPQVAYPPTKPPRVRQAHPSDHPSPPGCPPASPPDTTPPSRHRVGPGDRTHRRRGVGEELSLRRSTRSK